jgi:DNA-binding beta-propeller fold protein YncE
VGLKRFLVAAGALLVLASASVAQADTGFGQVGQFGSFGSGDGQFSAPAGVAVDQASNHVYVVDRGNSRVETFDSSGAFINTFGADVGGAGVDICTTACGPGTQGSGNGQFSSPTGITVDSSGNVYVVDSANNRVEKFSSSGAFLSQITATDPTCAQAFSNPQAVALAPVSGALYVADTANSRVAKIDPATGVCDGVFDGSIAASGTFSSPTGVATDSAGTIYVLDSGNARVEKFDSTGALLSALDSGGSPLALAVDATSNDAYVADESGTSGSHIIDYDSTGAVLGTFGFGLCCARGLAVNHALTKVYVTNEFALPASVLIFGQVTLPHTVTGAPSGVTATSATVAGTVNPDGTETSYSFQYGLDTTYSTGCSNPPCRSPSNSAGSGTSAVEATADLTELQPSAIYHYRLVGTNPSGSTFGADETFTTEGEAPAIVGESSSGLTPTAATLEARINPNNQETTYRFQYGTSPTLENPTEFAGATALSGFSAEGDLATIEAGGLTPNTAYYYRVIAENGTGKREGTIEQFDTLPPPPSAATGGASGVTRTAATLAGTVNPGSNGPHSDTTWCFEYGMDTTYASGIAGVPGNAGEGTTPVEVTAALNGLTPNATYHYRLVAVNSLNTTGASTACETSGGYETDGQDHSFTTVAFAPAVSTDEVAYVSANTATLAGSILPQGVDTQYHFEYGTTTNYGASAPVPDGDAGTGIASEVVTESITGLTPNATYHYRLVATSSGGTVYGWDQAFATSDIPIVQSAPLLTLALAPPSPQTTTFPDLFGLKPISPTGAVRDETPALTRAQRLSKALKACSKKPKRKHAACVKRARRRYATPTARKHRPGSEKR